MSVSVIILGAANEATKRSHDSVVVSAGEEVVVSVTQAMWAEVSSAIANTENEFIHLMWCSDIVLPSFYGAMTTALSFEKADYAVCQMLDLASEDPCVKDVNDPICSQVIFKKWIAEELGMPDVEILLQRLIAEYRGTSLPHVLCVTG